MVKATFIKSIGNVRWNGYGADLYENVDSSASIRFDRNTHPVPSKHFMNFSSLDDANSFIDSKTGMDGLTTLRAILDVSTLD